VAFEKGNIKCAHVANVFLIFGWIGIISENWFSSFFNDFPESSEEAIIYN